MLWRSAVFTAVAIVLSIALGGCSLMFPNRHDTAHPANPLSDDQAQAQVVDAAKQIAQLVTLPDMYGGFAFESCNDQGDPPYRGVVEMSFKPAGGDPDAFFNQVAATMVAHGWTDGPPPGLHPNGRVINKSGIMAVMSWGPNPGWSRIQVYGECRNMTDHHNDGKTNWVKITDRLR
ncbi:hypothetical protein OQ968_15090 [Mycobacterium sp. 663a-19]|uniref:hypothetical protein n=1 Tax=Mycobacterium sp. 663a-19 TaxID=2986148 RepID=UPI002D1E5C18|nr:hypothetical protein [Mycobacterium sp. 663a-19]MEB3982588.1 hypothetical protein [Mycobacterium sp. 663a-19]